MRSSEPRTANSLDRVLSIGRDVAGRWVVHESNGAVGALFADREAALRFALRECRRTPKVRVELAVTPLPSILAA